MANDIERIFSEAGGVFCIPIESLVKKLESIKAVLFDWDGVFNTGAKSEKLDSTFSEPDSMGINLLRFSYWMRHKEIPATAILSGEHTGTSVFFAKREYFSADYLKASDKKIAFNHFLKEHNLKPEQVLFIFDDVLDISVASLCGLRILVRRESSPLFNLFIQKHSYADYITFSRGGDHAIRESCELLIGLQEKYETVLSSRIQFSEEYQEYLKVRQTIETRIYVWTNGRFEVMK